MKKIFLAPIMMLSIMAFGESPKNDSFETKLIDSADYVVVFTKNGNDTCWNRLTHGRKIILFKENLFVDNEYYEKALRNGVPYWHKVSATSRDF